MKTQVATISSRTLAAGRTVLLVDVADEEPGRLVDPGAKPGHRRGDQRHDHQAAKPRRNRVQQHRRHDPLGVDRAVLADE